ncbi:MAG: flagellar motor switch protein FliG [candidate division KSB1 bacterium]|nr:flagellar motor switch protein FliG [candidate division KSB1 bacterium]MDZ7337811.1 flagellar motor switch protein FliG [candidate division KSB1 bacterium]MDZ7380091.1 flagellar motor switch protein FliG [candidate division KSB1 bacterium]MDZ7385520.1 flagellar motor switch protein FliG [candidate division KSB1 bacterium]MDZ7392627.1 flagellar motor switch protein FliG [candidate division KSB1 bacterium]
MAPSEKLSGRQKAAILLVALGMDASSQVLKELSEEELEQVTKEIANLGHVPSETVQSVIAEFKEMAIADEYVAVGGLDYAVNLLQSTVGQVKASEIIRKVHRSMELQGSMRILEKLDPVQLVNFIQKEHPQTIALVLTQLDAEQAAFVMSSLPEEIRSEVAYRFATMDRVSSEMIGEVQKVLKSRLELSVHGSELGGVKAAAEMLNFLGQSLERSILKDIGARDPALAEEIKNLMFVFEDIVLLDDRSIQRVLREVQTHDLALALKSTTPEVKRRIYQNMSERAQAMIEEEIQFMGPVRLSEVEKAQKGIVDIIRKLDEEGEIIITGRGEKEEIIV